MKKYCVEGVEFFVPVVAYRLYGRDGMVDIPWQDDTPVPVCREEWNKTKGGVIPPDYDMAGRGIHQLLRRNTDFEFAPYYASILKDAYPHIISELGGETIMIDAKEVDTPYLDRKIANLRIMSLIDPENGGLKREIARSFVEKGSRLASLNQAVSSWYGAETWFKQALEQLQTDFHLKHEYAETLYILGRYTAAAELWSEILTSLAEVERAKVQGKIAEILAGRVPKVPPLDYLTAISVALEENEGGNQIGAVEIIEDVLSDENFTANFPAGELYYLLGTICQECGMMERAAEAFRRS